MFIFSQKCVCYTHASDYHTHGPYNCEVAMVDLDGFGHVEHKDAHCIMMEVNGGYEKLSLVPSSHSEHRKKKD